MSERYDAITEYDTITEVVTEIRERGVAVDLESVDRAMTEASLRYPLGDADIDELLLCLREVVPRVDSPEEKLRRVLAGKHWSEAVIQARYRLELPANGVSLDAAIALHGQLIRDILLGHSGQSDLKGKTIPTFEFWEKVLVETAELCHW